MKDIQPNSDVLCTGAVLFQGRCAVLGATIYERYKTISIQTRATKGEEGSGGQDV